MRRTLGNSGIEVSALGLGCWAIGGVWSWQDQPGGWGEVDDAESVRAIRRALDLGVQLFDTAANYGVGHSERVLGEALRGRRGEAVIATKFGHRLDEAGRRVTFHDEPRTVILNVRQDCERSLARLGTDYIDLYQLHVGDFPADLVPDLVGELEGLVAAGMVRAYGWSTDDAELARAMAQAPHMAAVQHDLNVVVDAPDMLALCGAYGLASLNRTPLARGALTGKYTARTQFAPNDVRTDDWSRDRFFAPTYANLDALRDVLTSGGRSLTQGALAWIWARSPATIPIPGFRTVAQVEENARALEFGPLTPHQMAEVGRILS